MPKTASSTRKPRRRPSNRLQALFCKIAKCGVVTSTPMGGRQNKDGSQHSAMFLRAMACAVLFAIAALFLVRHIYKLMVIEHLDWRKKVGERVERAKTTLGDRGLIFDCNGVLLAGNLNTQRVLAEPNIIQEGDRAAVINLLARYLDLSKEELTERFRKVCAAPVTTRIHCSLTKENAEVISLWNHAFLKVVKKQAPDAGYELQLQSTAYTAEELERILEQLSPVINTSVADLKAIVDKSVSRGRGILLQNDLEYEKSLALGYELERLKKNLKKKKDRKYHTTGVRLESSTLRYYPQNERLSNLLGVVDPLPEPKTVNGKPVYQPIPIAEGVNGIEMLMDDLLRPTLGKVVTQKDSRGRPLSQNAVQEKTPARNGSDVYLTIDATIQQFAEEELAKMVAEFSPTRAYAVMMNPRTGAIMAMAQYPTFNPNNRARSGDESGFQNHLFTEVFEPGSIMKSIPISYALEKGVVTLGKHYYCEGGIWHYKGRRLCDTHDNRHISVSDIIMVSSNIGTAKVALNMGPGMLFDALTRYGFGKSTHAGFYPETGEPRYFSFESKGLLRPLERWDDLSITRFPIGQGISCTPLQMLKAYGAIANKGTMMQPYLVDKVVTDGSVVRSTPRVLGHPISPKTAESITSAMLRVVDQKEGTGTKAAMEGYRVAGKTGSAQVWNGVAYEEKLFNSSFVGFVPADNPQFVMLVTARNVHRHGGTVSAPVFKAVAQRTLEHLHIPPADNSIPPSSAFSTPR